MRHIWTISIENLKGDKMYEEEAVELLKVLKEKKEKLEAVETYQRNDMFYYSQKWTETFKALGEINLKIHELEQKMKDETKEEDDE